MNNPESENFRQDAVTGAPGNPQTAITQPQMPAVMVSSTAQAIHASLKPAMANTDDLPVLSERPNSSLNVFIAACGKLKKKLIECAQSPRDNKKMEMSEQQEILNELAKQAI